MTATNTTGRIASILVFLAVTGASAQPEGQVAGTVRDMNGNVLTGVEVEVSSQATADRVRSTITNSNGQYRIDGLPTGLYSIRFSRRRVYTERREAIQIPIAFTLPLNVRIQAEEEAAAIPRPSDSADIRGTVVDVWDVAKSGVVLTLSGPARRGMVVANGQFLFENVPVGEYDLRATLSGFATTVRKVTIVRGVRPLTIELSVGRADILR